MLMSRKHARNPKKKDEEIVDMTDEALLARNAHLFHAPAAHVAMLSSLRPLQITVSAVPCWKLLKRSLYWLGRLRF
jgi:hypothetical protein